MNEPTISKSTVDLYKIRFKGSEIWADITIDAKEHTGRIQIASDFGDWQYYWGSCGKSFKEFLISIDKGYVANKFGENNWFDAKSTKAKLLEDVEEEVTWDNIIYDTAQEIIEEINELFSLIGDDKNGYTCEIYHSDIVDKLYNGDCSCVPMMTDISPQFNRFWEEIWKVFIEHLKQEINQQT